MSLIILRLARKLPKLEVTAEKDSDEILVWIHYFKGRWHWYVIEFDQNDTFFGYVVGVEEELGYFSLSELYEIGVRRDLNWRCCLLSKIVWWRKNSKSKNY